MNVTELLVTGFHGDKAIFAASLTPGTANTIVTYTDSDSETAVESAVERADDAFSLVRGVVENLVRGRSGARLG